MARQAGMTLIELTVVLLVLIGLAGLMIPYVSGFVSKTHDSTGTSNLAQLNSTIQRYQGQYMSLPDDLHSLVENAASANANGIYDELMNPNFLTATTYSSDATMGVVLAEYPLSSLRMAGISSVYEMKDVTTNGSKTFDAGSASVNVPNPMMGGAASDVVLAVLNAGDKGSVEQHLADAFGGDINSYDSTCYDYVVMGVGQESQMSGRTLQDAPVHFAQNGDMGPDNKYNRFAAVFQVDKADSTIANDPGGLGVSTGNCSDSAEFAKLVGSAMLMMPNHLFGLQDELNRSYSNIAAN